MTGQIPKYGEHFRLESLPYSPHLANRAYVLKRDWHWFIRSGKTSEVWQVYHGASFTTAAAMGKPLPTLGQAMTRLLAGIAQGFYVSVDEPHPACAACETADLVDRQARYETEPRGRADYKTLATCERCGAVLCDGCAVTGTRHDRPGTETECLPA
jgi:hypothetical protein